VSEQDIDVVRDQFAAVNGRDFERAMGLYADDVTLTASEHSGPKAGKYEGKETVGEWFGDWFRTFAADYRFDLSEARDLGGGVLLIVASHGGSGRLSGVEVHGENAYLYRVRGGKVSQVGFFATREEAVEAAALPEWSGAETD
jgi:ketosteroid isomerase-like protein